MMWQPQHRPRFSLPEALRAARDHFGIAATWGEELPSDRDQNFLLLEEATGRRFVLKIAHAGEDPAVLDFQNRLLEHLALAGFPQSKVLRTPGGAEWVELEGEEGQRHLARLLTWIPGEPLCRVRPQRPALFEALGSFLGGMDRALEDFSHPMQDRQLPWDLKAAGRVVRLGLEAVEDPGRRDLLEEMSGRFLERLGPLVPHLRLSVIHGDANDHNVLVAPPPAGGNPEERRIAGIVDLGDAVRSFTVGEAAIAAAYAMLGKSDPLGVAARLVAGYHRAFPLGEKEVEALFPLMGLRLCASVVISARRKREEPALPYLTVSEAPAWELLARLEGESDDLAHFLFRQACGLEPVPGARVVVEWLRRHGAEGAPVVGDPEPIPLDQAPVHVFDLAVDTKEFGLAPPAEDAEAWSHLLFSTLAGRRARVGVGRYDEVRFWYVSPLFRAGEGEEEEWRTVHLGLDLFLPAGTLVFAPFDARVHSVADNAGFLDYGPTVILEHRLPSSQDHLRNGVRFWTLYGHLDREVLGTLTPGQEVPRGRPFAKIGAPPDNGGWAPHLHFQVITHLLGLKGNFPGVARPSQRDLWKLLSPDPNLILRLPDRAAEEGVAGSGWAPEPFPGPARPGRPSGSPLSPPPPRSREEILRLRKEYLGRNLSVAYRNPLVLVRGRGQFLYDREGQPYLDCVNNVPHVGHCHPKVVEAAHRQMALLNTNTRYLHEYLVEYAERLVALCPGNLSKVFFVSSGSEANELALRLARAYTRRKDILVVEGGYHGNTSSLVDISPYKFDGPGGYPPRRWVHKTHLPDPYRGRFRAFGPGGPTPPAPTPGRHRGGGGAPAPSGSGPAWARAGVSPNVEPQVLPLEEVGARYAEHVRQVVALMRAEGRPPAAFFVEPLLGCAGQIVPPPGYLEQAFRHVREAGGVCVADEVQVGFGRVGSHFWAFEAQGVVPDIVTLGKPIGNGHPLGAVITTPEIADAFDTGMEYFSTFGGNPVSCAVGLAVLDVLREEGLQENARAVGKKLMEDLRALQTRFPLLGDIRGMGLFLGVEVVSDPILRTPDPHLAGRLKERLREHRILLSTDGPEQNVLKIKPPMVFSSDDAQRLVDTLAAILEEDEFRR